MGRIPSLLFERSNGEKSCSRICGTTYGSRMHSVDTLLQRKDETPHQHVPVCTLNVGLFLPTQSHCACFPYTKTHILTKISSCSIYSLTQINTLCTITPTQHVGDAKDTYKSALCIEMCCTLPSPDNKIRSGFFGILSKASYTKPAVFMLGDRLPAYF